MATNPRIPNNVGPGPQLVRSRQRRHPGPAKSKFPRGILIGLAVAVLLGIFWYARSHAAVAPQTVSEATVLPAALGDQVQVSGIQMIPEPSRDALYLDGRITNTGSGVISGATAQIKLHDRAGKVIADLERPIEGIGDAGGDKVDEFVRRPIQPNDTRFFRVVITPIPAEWNHETPDLQVQTVTAK